MARLSRPYQVALVALLVLAAVWLVALRGHSSSNSATSSAVPTPQGSAQSAKGAAPSAVYHGPAPGVEGLTRDIAKARETVAASQKRAKSLEEKSAQASPAALSLRSKSSTTAAGTVTTRAATRGASHAGARAPVTGANRVPAGQMLVERELKQGYVVALVFLNPNGSDDVAVHEALEVLLAAQRRVQPPAVQGLLRAAGRELGDSSVVLEPGAAEEKIFVQSAPASRVASFGSITSKITVFQTPTILIVEKSGKTRTLTGLADAFAIEQALDEPYPQGRPQP